MTRCSSAETPEEKQACAPDHPVDGLSRRTWLGGAAMVCGAGISCVVPTIAEAKVTQQAASYQAEPKSKSNLCATCKYFIAPKSCVLVEGDVSPAGWCQLYEKKSG